jgi:hypothetical protein
MDQIREQVLAFPVRGTRPKPVVEVAFSSDKNLTTKVMSNAHTASRIQMQYG